MEDKEAFPTPAIDATDATAAPKTRRPRAAAPAADADISFKTATAEQRAFDVMDIRGRLLDDGHCYWDVPADLVERFERHVFVATGRIIRE